MNPEDRADMRERLLRLHQEVVALDPDAMGSTGAIIAGTIDEPLRVAVVGRVKAGKSTLVNALVGRRVAPTDEAECTRVVTWYRYGTPERAELHLLDGTVLPLRGDGEQLLPADLPAPLADVSHAVVHLQQALLRDHVLIDTPGLGSVSTELAAATRRAVLQTAQADALIYVVRERELADDAEFLRERALSVGARGASAADTIGVLSHADDVGGGPWAALDPLEQAQREADRFATRRRADLGAVVPLAGLLAEAAVTGRIGEEDADLLAALHRVDPEDLQDGIGLPDGIEQEQVERLAERIGWYAVAHGREVAVRGASALMSWADRVTGRRRLQQELRSRYVGRHRQLRAAQVLTALELAADSSSRRREIRDAIAEARLERGLHPLRELAAWDALRGADPRSPLLEELGRVMDAEDDRAAVGLQRAASGAEVVDAARRAAAERHADVLFASVTAEQVAARVLAVSYERIAERSASTGTW